MYFVNVTSLFLLLWKIVQTFLNEAHRKKMVILEKGYKEILEIVHPD